jgi:hypothetical protein
MKHSIISLFVLSLLVSNTYSEAPDVLTTPQDHRIATESTVGTEWEREWEVIAADSPYRDVKIIDKFGKWPEKEGEPYYSSQVGTWFTVWWSAKGGKTFDFWTRENWTRLKPLDYGYYCSGDEDYLISVLIRLKYIGIDFIALDDTNGHWNAHGVIAENIASCFQTADSLGDRSPQVAICSGHHLRANERDAQRRELDHYYSEFVEKHPDAFFHWKGKPMVVMYLAGAAGRRMEDDRFTIRYGTGLATWQNRTEDTHLFETEGNWAWVFDIQNPDSEVMGTQPGYNKAHQGNPMKPVPRESGKRYIAQWLAAIKRNPECIVIPSYNDHAEETGWEATLPTRPAITSAAQDVPGEDPYLYEKITEGYLALRYGFIESFHYRVEGSDQVFVFEAGELEKADARNPLIDPVIVLPDDYLKWYRSRSSGLDDA